MNKLNQRINDGEPLSNTFLNNIVDKVNEVIDQTANNNVFMMPQDVYSYLRNHGALHPGFIGTYETEEVMTEVEILAWIEENYK